MLIPHTPSNVGVCVCVCVCVCLWQRGRERKREALHTHTHTYTHTHTHTHTAQGHAGIMPINISSVLTQGPWSLKWHGSWALSEWVCERMYTITPTSRPRPEMSRQRESKQAGFPRRLSLWAGGVLRRAQAVYFYTRPQCRLKCLRCSLSFFLFFNLLFQFSPPPPPNPAIT